MIRFAKFFKIFLVFLSLSISLSVNASIWDAIAACFTNPCNCGLGSRNESWGPYDTGYQDTYPTFYRSFARNEICMPANRYGGRDGCLKQFTPPNGIFPTSIIMSYRSYCAEATSATKYNAPKIKVRMQACSFLTCFANSKDLNAAEGECVQWPTQYGLPTIRFCARRAIKKPVPRITNGTVERDSNGNVIYDYNATDGYTNYVLDRNGYPILDSGFLPSNAPAGFPRIYKPKVCLYEDPSIYESFTSLGGVGEDYRQTGGDLYDTNKDRQILDYNPAAPTLGDQAGFLGWFSGKLAANQIVERIFNFNNNDSAKRKYFSASSPTFHSSNSSLTATIGTTNVDANIDNYNNTNANRVVSGESTTPVDITDWVKKVTVEKTNSLGCVEMPIGPYPPPFCPTLPLLTPPAVVEKICAQNAVLDTTFTSSTRYLLQVESSTAGNSCVRSPMRNNFIHNTVRIGFNDLVPLCSDSNINAITDTSCVQLRTPTPPLTLAAIDANFNGIIPKCGANPNSSELCITTGLIARGNGFRIVYGIKNSADEAPIKTNAYPSDISNICTENTGVYPCKTIWGVNKGDFRDINVPLNSVNDGTIPTQPLASDEYTLTDVTGVPVSVKALLMPNPPTSPEINYNDNSSITITPNSLCGIYRLGDGSTSSFESAGCVARAKPLVLNLQSSAGSTHLAPRGLVRMDFGGANNSPADALSAILTAQDLKNSTKYNFYGFEIDTLVTDATFIKPPFSGSTTPTDSSGSSSNYTKWGEYLGGIAPFSSTGTRNTNSKYLRGLEYANGIYVRGGTKFCVGEVAQARCGVVRTDASQSSSYDPSQPSSYDVSSGNVRDYSNCVLSKLTYSDRVNCQTFKNYGALPRCNSTQASDNTATSTNLPDLQNSSSTIVTIKTWNTGAKCFVSSALTGDVCVTSNNPADRVVPAYTPSTVSLNPQQFYDNTKTTAVSCISSSELYNPAKCEIRDKSLVEYGKCIDVPAPSPCAATSIDSTRWVQTAVGNSVVGTCNSGYGLPGGDGALAPRYCIMEENNLSIFEPVTDSMKCVISMCPAITTASASSGYATWPATAAGQNANGTCMDYYYAPKTSAITRTCNSPAAWSGTESCVTTGARNAYIKRQGYADFSLSLIDTIPSTGWIVSHGGNMIKLVSEDTYTSPYPFKEYKFRIGHNTFWDHWDPENFWHETTTTSYEYPSTFKRLRVNLNIADTSKVKELRWLIKSRANVLSFDFANKTNGNWNFHNKIWYQDFGIRKYFSDTGSIDLAQLTPENFFEILYWAVYSGNNEWGNTGGGIELIIQVRKD